MLDSLMALKDLDDVPGLPPLSAIEDMRYEKNTRKSTRADIERSKQEEIRKSDCTCAISLFPMLEQKLLFFVLLTETKKNIGSSGGQLYVKGDGVSVLKQ
ncbi:hypothetical protein Tco_0979004 [Tanacetum coccineum]|uniref:Uncharacterized protein n=1 Tax=Tanacetum coccineum TaxID=301880 RepID=A0ABQ5EPN9_9ASTR